MPVAGAHANQRIRDLTIAALSRCGSPGFERCALSQSPSGSFRSGASSMSGAACEIRQSSAYFRPVQSLHRRISIPSQDTARKLASFHWCCCAFTKVACSRNRMSRVRQNSIVQKVEKSGVELIVGYLRNSRDSRLWN